MIVTRSFFDIAISYTQDTVLAPLSEFVYGASVSHAL